MNRRPPKISFAESVEELVPPTVNSRRLSKRTTITIDDITFVSISERPSFFTKNMTFSQDCHADDLEKISVLGRGAYGVVEKMKHIRTGKKMAVKRVASTINTEEQVRDCP